MVEESASEQAWSPSESEDTEGVAADGVAADDVDLEFGLHQMMLEEVRSGSRSVVTTFDTANSYDQ